MNWELITSIVALVLSIISFVLTLKNIWFKPPIRRVENEMGYSHYDKDDKLINSQKK